MPTTKPIPEGFHSVTPHLICADCTRALDFYGKAFGAVERFRMPSPDGSKLWHAEIQIGNSVVMLADEFPEMGCVGPKALGGTPVNIHLYVEDVDAAFDRAVKAGVEVKMPPTDMFWGDRYAKIVDPYGHSWSLATHVNDPTPEEMQAAAAAMAGEDCS